MIAIVAQQRSAQRVAAVISRSAADSYRAHLGDAEAMAGRIGAAGQVPMPLNCANCSRMTGERQSQTAKGFRQMKRQMKRQTKRQTKEKSRPVASVLDCTAQI